MRTFFSNAKHRLLRESSLTLCSLENSHILKSLPFIGISSKHITIYFLNSSRSFIVYCFLVPSSSDFTINITL